VRQIEIEPVDERDSNWEVRTPRFRVYLHGGGPDKTYGRTWTYDITGADALQAIDWARRQAGDRLTYALALVLDDPTEEQRNPGHGRGLVWLVGMDGNDNPEEDPEQRQVQQRMLMRRTKPVVIPPSDAVPPGAFDPFNDGTEGRSVV
jgi:hypothetical protein